MAAMFSKDEIFQLTPSRRATIISVSKVREERYFNSRPHGGRRAREKSRENTAKFQLTPSRRATYQAAAMIVEEKYISTHALTEGD